MQSAPPTAVNQAPTPVLPSQQGAELSAPTTDTSQIFPSPPPRRQMEVQGAPATDAGESFPGPAPRQPSKVPSALPMDVDQAPPPLPLRRKLEVQNAPPTDEDRAPQTLPPTRPKRFPPSVKWQGRAPHQPDTGRSPLILPGRQVAEQSLPVVGTGQGLPTLSLRARINEELAKSNFDFFFLIS